MPHFAEVKGPFIESKGQIKADEGILKSHLLNQKKNFQLVITELS